MKNEVTQFSLFKKHLPLFATFLLLGVFFFQLSAFAQQKSIAGSVRDDQGKPIPGASVIVKGTIIGITTDIDGNFSLNVPATAKTLVISFMGLTSKEIQIVSTKVFNVTLS